MVTKKKSTPKKTTSTKQTPKESEVQNVQSEQGVDEKKVERFLKEKVTGREEKVFSEERDEILVDKKDERYIEAVGRRKTAVARVRLFTKGQREFLVNEKPYQEYFSTPEDREIAVASLKKMKCLDKFRVIVRVKGGGHHAQAEAVRHGIARALVKFNPNFKKRLRRAGFLTRDPRMRERKKFGLKRARRAPQWQKR